MTRRTRTFRRQIRRTEVDSERKSDSVLLTSFLLCFICLLLFFGLENQEPIATEKKRQKTAVQNQIVDDLIVTFKESNLPISVDSKNGVITLDSTLLFEKGSATISEEGRKHLEKFVPKYFSILLSDRFRNEIDQIVIEGHTDPSGSYLYNLELSQARASAVVRAIYDPEFPNFPYKKELQPMLSANGRSFSKPVREKNGTIDAAKSRRVEIKFRLKDR